MVNSEGLYSWFQLLAMSLPLAIAGWGTEVLTNRLYGRPVPLPGTLGVCVAISSLVAVGTVGGYLGGWMGNRLCGRSGPIELPQRVQLLYSAQFMGILLSMIMLIFLLDGLGYAPPMKR